MKFFDLPNKPLVKRERKQRTVTTALEREEIPFVEFTDEELYAAKGGVLVFDIEIYFNYYLVAFRDYTTERVAYFELSHERQLDIPKLLRLIYSNCIVGFNSATFDIPLLWLSLNNAKVETLKEAANFLIKEKWRPSDIEKSYGFKMGQINHIDLIEVAPLSASLKSYMGRMNAKRLQDLPYDPEAYLTPEQMKHVCNYCLNDLEGTALLLKELSPQLELRASMSIEYRQDLRSKSDAQLAEAVICGELKAITGYYPKRPTIEPGTVYKYKVPDFVSYQTPLLQKMLEIIRNANFVIADNGQVLEPAEFEQLKALKIGSSIYRMGIGGLHSTEENASHVATSNIMIIDRDVASYYPSIILNQGLYPKHLSENFLHVYRSIVTRRLAAKKAKNKTVADSLKICINGSFGKLGSKYSSLYSPDLMLQVTISGQLCLLMLIEAIELSGIPVVSGNTDGIIIKCPVERYDELNNLISAWEKLTNFETEETRYKAVYSRDVNNFIIVKYKYDEEKKQWTNELDGCKVKGCYSEKGSALNSRLSKNPEMLICSDAVQKLLTHNIPIEETILNCKDLTRFLTVRNVKGGAEKDGIYLGKSVRYYYAKGVSGTINYVINGHVVPKSEGAIPCMDLPLHFPDNIDYEKYIQNTIEIMYDIGYYKRECQQKLF